MASERLTPERLDQIEEWACNANDKEYPYPYAARGLVVVQGVWELLAGVKAAWSRIAALEAERDALRARAERTEAAMRAYLEAGRAWAAVLDGPRGDDWMERVNAAERANMDAMKGMSAALAAAAPGEGE